MKGDLLKKSEEWLMKALGGDFEVDAFKAVTQLYAGLSKTSDDGIAKPFSPEECREGLDVFFGKETQ